MSFALWSGGMERYLRQDLGTNLESRLRKLEETGYDVGLLRVHRGTRHASRAGRVSRAHRFTCVPAGGQQPGSGIVRPSQQRKILAAECAPEHRRPARWHQPDHRCAYQTGLWGNTARRRNFRQRARMKSSQLRSLAKLVTEQGNPGNLRNVVRAMVQVPSPRLKQGIVLVDTPGLGSLARRGGAETLAYLPSCDLALLLIDAGATLNEEDVGTLRLLYGGCDSRHCPAQQSRLAY